MGPLGAESTNDTADVVIDTADDQNGSDTDAASIDERFERMLPVFFGLLRYARIHFIHQYRRELLLFIKTIVKEVNSSF